MRLPHSSPQRLPAMPPSRSTLSRRSSGTADWRALMAAGIIIFVFLCVALFAFFRIRSVRTRQNRPKERSSPSWLTRKWAQWNPLNRNQKYSSRLQDDDPSTSSRARSGDTSRAREMVSVEAANADADAAGVDRHTSVRSIMTLPAYSLAARENERILAREGERAGIDVVVEFPEGDDEEEQHRNEEMESLYQIRVARRAEQAEREDRRRRRREARERGDMETLSRLRRESRQRTNQGAASSATLIAEHQAAQAARDRRVSSVQYAALGVQRHDGTRLRANSTEDDNRPLLDSAASMADTNRATPTVSRMTHHRDFSATSIMSNSTTASEDAWQATQRNNSNDSRSGSGATDFEVINLSRSRSASGSRLTPAVTGASDIGTVQIPAPEPPQYDDLGWEEAPPYTSPVENRVPQLPAMNRLPSIHITDPTTPVESRPIEQIQEVDETSEAPSPHAHEEHNHVNTTS